MSTIDKMKEMTDVELYYILKNPTSKLEYNKAFSTVYLRYKRLIDKQWYILCKQLNCGWTNNYKEDFYSLAGEAFMQAIARADESKFKDNFKFVQMVSWLVGNVRINLIKDIIRRESKLESVYGIDKNSESKLTLKPRVQRAYYESIGFEEQPDYICEHEEQEEMLSISIELCKKKWSVKKKTIYEYMSRGVEPTEIAEKAHISQKSVSQTINLMNKDIRRELIKIARKRRYID